MTRRLATAGLLASSLVTSLLLGEWALRTWTLFPIHSTHRNRIPDERLHYRTSPIVLSIDRNGFRNERALAHADIAALGDSHTYGYNVESAESWPQVLGRELGLSVYNFGTGGYNLVHYVALLDDALALSPETLVVGFYPRNDLNGFCVVLNLPYWRRHRALLGLDADHCADRPTPRFGSGADDDRALHIRFADESAWISALRYWTGIGSPVVRDWTVVRYGDALSEGDAPVARSSEAFEVQVGERSLLLPRRDPARTPGENERNLGFRAFRTIKHVTDDQGVDLTVLMIPSPYLVVRSLLQERGAEPSYTLESSVSVEVETWTSFQEFFDREKIRYADALPYVTAAFCKALEQGEGFYPDWAHPLAAGQTAYARSVAATLGTREPLTTTAGALLVNTDCTLSSGR